MNFAERLYEAFDDAGISWESARAVGEIPKADSILTKANHVEVKVSDYPNTKFYFFPQLLKDFFAFSRSSTCKNM